MAEEEPQGFLSRWSRRKALVREGLAPGESVQVAVPPPAAAPQAKEPEPIRAEAQSQSDAASMPAPTQARSLAQPEAPRLTLEDVQALDAHSDYSAFVSRTVDTHVRNAAMKKLFHADPHFNVMDGLDVYIDDYNNLPSIPKAELRQMMQARFLGLLDDELVEQDKPVPDDPPPHEDVDLQLQSDDAAGCASPDEAADAQSVGDDEPGLDQRSDA